MKFVNYIDQKIKGFSGRDKDYQDKNKFEFIINYGM